MTQRHRQPRQQPQALAYTPPAHQEAEQSVLGAILVRPEVLDTLADMLRPGDFYREAHGLIYRAILDLYGRGEPVDLVTVSAHLKERGKLEAVGGPAFLAGLSEEVGFATNAGYYARLVSDKAVLRRILDCSQEIAAACLAPVENVPEFLDRAEQKVFDVVHGDRGGDMAMAPLGDLAKANWNHLETLFYQGKEATGLLTGFYDYDRYTAGLHPGELTVLAARPGMGKTALALNIAWNVGQDNPVAFFSLEMDKARQLITRMVAQAGRIDGDRLRRCRLTQGEWAQRGQVQMALEDAKIWIDDTPGLTPLQLRARCRRLKARQNLALVIVDYLQLMRVPGMRSREEEIREIAYSLKELSKELGVPVLAAAQVNRDVEKRSGTRYQLSDLRESGAIEQASDNVLFLYREKEGVVAKMDLAKQRNGRVGFFELAYSAPFCRFDNYVKDGGGGLYGN
jgi:replicative DNA helicase